MYLLKIKKQATVKKLTAPWGICQIVVDLPEKSLVERPYHKAKQLQEIQKKGANKEYIGKQEEPDRPALPTPWHDFGCKQKTQINKVYFV